MDHGFNIDVLRPHGRRDATLLSSATPTSATFSAATSESAAQKTVSMFLSPQQQVVISSVERTGAGLSMIGVILIILAFFAFKRLRTVPNTFILCASIANIGASVACFIGYAGIIAGEYTALCQAQAFLLEMFMQSDSWWSLAMAINVFLVFFRAANPTSFRRYLWLYCLICFGVPGIPAIVLLIWQKAASTAVYGNATLWCWIDDPKSSLRIWSYYLPIWVCILVSALIYVAVGYHVFHHRNQLRNMTLSTQGKEMSTSEIRSSADKNGLRDNTSYGMVTTEVHISAAVFDVSPSGTPIPSIGAANRPLPPLDTQLHPWASTGEACINSPTNLSMPQNALARPQTSSFTMSSISSSHRPSHAQRQCSATRASISTSGWSFSCFTAIYQRFRRRLRRLDPVKLAYLRTSFVFALSVLVTWTPSSINRVYALANPNSPSYPLNLASAIVLPLQGVWNAVIFFSTSWKVLSEELQKLRLSWSARRRLAEDNGACGDGHDGPFGRGSGFPCTISHSTFGKRSAAHPVMGAGGGMVGCRRYDDGWRLAPDEAMGIEIEDVDDELGRRAKKANLSGRDVEMELGLTPFRSAGRRDFVAGGNGLGRTGMNGRGARDGVSKPPPASVRVMRNGTL